MSDQRTHNSSVGTEWVVTIEATGAGADAELVEQLVNTLPSAAASGGDGQASVTFAVDAASARNAVSVGMGYWSKVTTGVDLEVVRVEASTAARVDEDLDRPNFPVLLGVAELAQRLGVSKSRASELARLDTFPRPVAHLASGPVWTEASVSGHLEGWERKPGRPKKDAALRDAMTVVAAARHRVAAIEDSLATNPELSHQLADARAILRREEDRVMELRLGQ